MERFPGAFEEVNGKYIIERYLYDDIWETMVVDEEYNQANFLLAKLVPTTYERLSTMGTATLWKMIMASCHTSTDLQSLRREINDHLQVVCHVC